ncbi:hypothetical protein [Luteimonas mephitis]|uniref:hypothetical protein n=1 Tax=Luteimonas mephitis TaxID=83615 RepID=UPI003A9316EC
MRTAIAALLATSLLLLAGCKIEAGTTTITNVSIDGKAQNVMRSYVNGGAGDFECIKSISGHCHYLLFVRECGNDKVAAAGTRCGIRTVQAFTLDAGTSRQLANLPPKLKQCVSHDRAPSAPDCLASQG